MKISLTQNGLTQSDKTVLRYYIEIGEPQFYRSLGHIAEDLKMDEKTVRRANDKLRDLGILVWKSGFGSAGNRKCPNHYWLTKETLSHLSKRT